MSDPSVVRIYATTQEPDHDSPWQASSPSSSTGSGVIIGPRRVLTGAHVVADATFLQVQKVSDPNKFIARVVRVAHDCDLALLEVEDPAFSDDVDVAEIGELPSLRDRVSVVGYPIGGEEISVTEGVVSRIEVQRYSHSQRYLLAATVDAAINQGNSGGPAFLDGKVAGIAFQTLDDAENIGEIVPAPVVRTFLRGIDAGRAPEVPGLGVITQNLENPTLRARLGMPAGRSGVLVSRVEFGGACWGAIEAGDALLSINGMPIANNGTIQYRGQYRTRFSAELAEHFVGDRIELEILRSGALEKVTVELAPQVYLVPRSQYDRQPSYFVYAGLVFQPLTRDFLSTWDEWWNKAPKEFLHHYYVGVRTPERREVVVLSQVLADEINVGYEDLYNESIVSVNGVKPGDMREFVDLLSAARGRVELRTSADGVIVLDADEVAGANQRILERYHIQHDRSPELRA